MIPSTTTTAAPPGVQATPGGVPRRPHPLPRVVSCTRAGCTFGAWFVIHHVAVCSAHCAEQLAAGAPARSATPDRPAPPRCAPVARAVCAIDTPLTLVAIGSGGRGALLRCWWWSAPTQCGAATLARTIARDVSTDAGLLTVLRTLVRRTGDPQLRALRIAAWAFEAGTGPAPWRDVLGMRDPLTHARRARRRAYVVAKQRALRARHRQRGTSQDATAAHAARVA